MTNITSYLFFTTVTVIIEFDFTRCRLLLKLKVLAYFTPSTHFYFFKFIELLPNNSESVTSYA